MQRMAANDVKDATADSGPPGLPEATKPDLLTIDHRCDCHCCHSDRGLYPRGAWSRRHVRSHGWAAAGALHGAFRMQRGHASGSGGRDARQSDLWNAVLGAVRSVKQSANWRYFFWLMMTFNLFGVGGYFLFSGIGSIGDWAEVVAGWQPTWAWRVGLAALGIVTYFFLFVPLSLREQRPFLGRDAKIRVRRARQLALGAGLQATGAASHLAQATGAWRCGKQNPFPTSPHPRRRLRTKVKRGVTLTFHLVQNIGQVTGGSSRTTLPSENVAPS
jgi:hypothetical protein